MKKLGFLVAIGLGAAMAGCGGGSSTPAAVTPTPTPTPTATPTPGPVQVAYTSSFGATSAATASPAALGFPAPTLSATVTATESGYTGAFTAASSCASVTVTPASSATGTFTVTGATPATTGCTLTFTGAVGFPTGTLTSTVATPAGVVLRWYTPQYAAQLTPQPQTATPINLVGFGATYAAILAVSEQNYVGGFTAANITTNAGCTGSVAVAPATPVGLPTAAPPSTSVAQSLSYYSVTASALPATTCTITATDNYAPTTSGVSINVLVSSASGTFQ